MPAMSRPKKSEKAVKKIKKNYNVADEGKDYTKGISGKNFASQKKFPMTRLES